MDVNQATAAVWNGFADRIRQALEALPSLGPSITVTHNSAADRTRDFVITFGGVLTGQEYDLTARVTNTSEAAILPAHSQIGDTEGEPAVSASRGWPGFAVLVQMPPCGRNRRAFCSARPENISTSISRRSALTVRSSRRSAQTPSRKSCMSRIPNMSSFSPTKRNTSSPTG